MKNSLRYESVHGKAPILDRDALLYYLDSTRKNRLALGRQNWSDTTQLNKTDKLNILGATTVQGDSLCRGFQIRVMKYKFVHISMYKNYEIDCHNTIVIFTHTTNTFRIKPRGVI